MPEHDRPGMHRFGDLSVVVPIAPGDETWRALLPDLAALDGAEVIFAATNELAASDRIIVATARAADSWSWLVAPRGRARQLNAGARAAERDHLWFLHADSRFATDTVPGLHAALRAAPDALHYFDLAFLPDGPRTMKLNALGAHVRSRWLGMPFGDQGFAIRRSAFVALGGFDESAPYGEDHLFVWHARRAGLVLRATGGTLRTSARRYRERGWTRTTLRHVWLTARQAVPEWLALARQRLRNAPDQHESDGAVKATGHGDITDDRAASVAIAVWVKTPGYTPAKTRLATAIGTPAAEAFHRLAVDAVREIVDDACRLAPGVLAPYWAVAESDVAAHVCWTDFPVVPQGAGALGDRLAHVYDALQSRHRAVLFIGADSPQLSADVLVNAAALLAESPAREDFVVGPAVDGGFYLFGGGKPIPRWMWTSVRYSAPTTMAELIAVLEPIGRVQLLATTFDVDTIDELMLLRDEMTASSGGGAARRALREWLASVRLG